MRKDILLHLAAKLDELQAELDARPKIPLPGAMDDEEFSPFTIREWAEQTECGFAGCMVGWAAQDQWLQPFDISLYLKQDGDVLLPVLNAGEPLKFTQDFAKLLEISTMTLDSIIMGNGYTQVTLLEGREVEPRDVAAKIRQVVAKGVP